MGGLSAALGLQRAGIQVSVYEQAPTLSEVGAGLTLAPNAMHVCRHLGIEERLLDIGVAPKSAAIKHYQSGEILSCQDRAGVAERQYGAPYLQIHRADLHDALIDSVTANDPDCLHLGHEFDDLEQDTDQVLLKFANGTDATADVVIGADGVRSRVRDRLFGATHPTFTGHVAWRGLVPADALPEAIKPDSAVSIGPRRLITRYYIRNRTLINFVAFARMSGWEIESWSERADIQELFDTFADWNPEVQMLLEAMPPETCFKWALFSRDPMQQWTKGRVTLLGDAAHPMLPFLGMGAATALEDGLVLARCFELSGKPAAALAGYEGERIPRGNFIMAESEKRVSQTQPEQPEKFDKKKERNEETLGLFDYDAGSTELSWAAGT